AQPNDACAAGEAPTSFRSFGTYAVWFPRGLMLRLAARQACGRLLADWQAAAEPTASAEVEAACARALADPGLRFEAICARLEEGARTPAEGAPADLLAGVLAGLEEQAVQPAAEDGPAAWGRQALGRIREWVGESTHGGDGSDWRKSRLSRSLWNAAQQLAQEWDERLANAAFALMDHPGRRVAAAEGALARFVEFCLTGAAGQRARLEQRGDGAEQAAARMETALEACY